MTDERKQELFPYFAYMYSQQMDPDKYGNVSTDEWSNLIKDNQDDIDKITEAAGQLGDEDWDQLDKQYTDSQQQSQDSDLQFAAKGAKLKKLKATKTAKCSCGCELITTKEEGGKISTKCACGCKNVKHIIKKKQMGGSLDNIINDYKIGEIISEFKKGGSIKKSLVKKKQSGGDTEMVSQVVQKKGGRIKKAQVGATINKYNPKKPYSKTNFDNTYNKKLEGLKSTELNRLDSITKKGVPESDDKLNPRQVLKKYTAPAKKKHGGPLHKISLTKEAMQANDKKRDDRANPVITPAEKDSMLHSRIKKARLKAKRK